jgi:hypothetical protein
MFDAPVSMNERAGVPVRWRLFQTAGEIVHNDRQTSWKISTARQARRVRRYSRTLRARHARSRRSSRNIPIAGATFSRAR